MQVIGGEARGLGLENLMAECLDAALRTGDDPDRRSRTALRTAAWSLLDKPWKALLMIALRKEALPERDEEGKVKRAKGRIARQRRRGGSARRRMGTTAGADAWLADADAIIDGDGPAAYRLAVLLVHRGRGASEWTAALDDAISGLRGLCDDGIHPVWARLARETPLLAELSEYPTSEIEDSQGVDVTWVEAARFDPHDHRALGEWLEKAGGVSMPTEISLALQRLARELRGKRPVAALESGMPDGLNSLDGASALVAGMILAAVGSEEALGAFERAASEPAVVEIAESQKALVRLRSGNDEFWLECALSDGEDGLAVARRTVAWSSTPPEHITLEINDLQRGIGHLESVGVKVPETLRWRVIESVGDEGGAAAAADLATTARIDDDEAFQRALAIASDAGDSALVPRLVEEVSGRSDEVLTAIVLDSNAPAEVTKAAGIEMLNRGKVTEVEDALVSIFFSYADAPRLARLLASIELPGDSHPHATLLTWHLLPAESDASIIDAVEGSQRAAHAALSNAAAPVVASEVTETLVRLLAGARANLDEIVSIADAHGIPTLREVRRALGTEGDGLIRADRIDQLATSIEEANLAEVERLLFRILVISLRLNRAANDLQSGEAAREKQAVSILDSIVDDGMPARFLSVFEDLVIEHEVPLPNLAAWYRVHRPTSPFGTVVNAAIQQDAGDGLRAARAYQEAAPHFDFERATHLYRKALISFALACRWSEAVDLLDRHPELAAAVTRRFQLYLRVCNEFEHDNSGSGRGRRQERDGARKMILDHVEARVPRLPEERDDPLIASEQRSRMDEVLDMLSNYPDEHSLPREPFIGRVRAATRHLQRSRRSRRNEQERRFLDALSEDGTPLEIVEIANDAADDDPVRGLRMLERAMNAGGFLPREMMALRNAQQAIFSQHQPEIRVRERRHLRNLSLPPLILVDTNMLIDALKARVLCRLSMEEDVLPHPSSTRAFHRMLRFHSEDSRIRLYIPAAARNEFRNRTMNPEKVFGLFGDRDPWIDTIAWEECITQKVVEELAEGIDRDFSDWAAPQEEGFNQAVQSYREAVEEFLAEHRDIYLRVDDIKRSHRSHIPDRSEIDGERIYPEAGDLDILRTAAALSDAPLPSIGSVLIATRDADFTLVARALEETFGIGVVSNAQQFSRWMH